ncbi:MAG: thymidine phosphorylase [Verrucomicrobiota bacterium]
MLPQEIIAKKRDRQELTRAEIEEFVTGVVRGTFTDYQAAALLMAVVLNGMSTSETAWLTEAMMRSGRVIEHPEITRPKVDKHSTGGVGDKVSLILAPLAAACGLCVPMMSGRGLGHTGGTLDKLEAIPGFSVQLEEPAYRAQLQTIHHAIIGQSEDMVPADRQLYSLRDVTATIESIPLICSSILSKKLAEGIDALVLDVKCGNGAFMETEAGARELAAALVSISQATGKPTTALITRMEQPLGRTVGNALEVAEAIECLQGQGPADLMEVTTSLVAEMLRLGGLLPETEPAEELIRAQLQNGAALQAFRALLQAQGGDPRVCDQPSLLPQAAHREALSYQGSEPAYVTALHARRVGEAARLLGAGRAQADAVIDLAVGVVLAKKIGAPVTPGETLATLHYNDATALSEARDRLGSAYAFATEPPLEQELLIDRIEAR